ncbi:MAG: hypothetical protein ABJB11_19575 [Ferruginibacter sp.]
MEMLNIYSTAEWLPDRSGYPAEGFVGWLCGGVKAYSRNCG